MFMPKDPIILFSVVNTLLRDRYSTLDALCEEEQVSREELCALLTAAGYTYDAAGNRFC